MLYLQRTEGDEKTCKHHGWISKYIKCLYSRMPADTTCTDGADRVSALIQSVLSKTIISVSVLSWPCRPVRSHTHFCMFFLRVKSKCVACGNSPICMFIHLVWSSTSERFLGWEFPDKRAPRPHFWSEDKGAKEALLCLRLARKLLALQHADSCTYS